MVTPVHCMLPLVYSADLLLNTVPPIRQTHSDLVNVFRVPFNRENVRLPRVCHWLLIGASLFALVDDVFMIPDDFLQLG